MDAEFLLLRTDDYVGYALVERAGGGSAKVVCRLTAGL